MKPIIILSFLLSITHSACSQTLGITPDLAGKPPDFSKLSYLEADHLVRLEDGRQVSLEYLTNLVTQIRSGQLSDDNKTLAIYLLGTFRPTDTNSIEALIENIDFRASKIDPGLSFIRWGQYPAAGALMKIGMPSVSPILSRLPAEGNLLRRRLMCDVLIFVEGQKDGHYNKAEGEKIVQNQINNKLARESDPAKRANLKSALKELAK